MEQTMTERDRAISLNIYRREYARNMKFLVDLREGRKVFTDLKKSTANMEVITQCNIARMNMLEDIDSVKLELEDLMLEAEVNGFTKKEIVT
jgi:hypothetical protein